MRKSKDYLIRIGKKDDYNALLHPIDDMSAMKKSKDFFYRIGKRDDNIFVTSPTRVQAKDYLTRIRKNKDYLMRMGKKTRYMNLNKPNIKKNYMLRIGKRSGNVHLKYQDVTAKPKDYLTRMGR